MFTTIYKYELKYWIKQPVIYVYALIIFSLAVMTMSGMAGEDSNRFGGKMINSPAFLLGMTRKFMILIFLTLPAVFGLSVYRDFSSRMHTILYAYPFTKRAYLSAKYLSALTVFMGIASMMGLGYVIGAEFIPGGNPDLLQAFNPLAYLQLYGLFVLPNILLLSTIVFSVVLLSRNIYAGFIAALLLIVIQQIAGSNITGGDASFMTGLLDPIGVKAFSQYSIGWTVDEWNTRLLPFEGVVIWNRLFWLSIAAVVFYFTYRTFNFSQTSLSLFRTSALQPVFSTKKMGLIKKISLPKVDYDFSFLQKLKRTWKLSQVDFKHVVTSRSFLSLIMGGVVLMAVLMSTVNSRFETETLPMTWQLLEIPSMFYSGIINAITFLYAGFLIQRGKMSNMNQLIDASPVNNWMLLGSKFIALVKIQMVLLLIVMMGGIFTQITKGFYQFEIDQYLLNLFVVNLIHFVIWAMLALFVQTLIDNPYIGFFLLIFAPVGFIGMSEFGPKHLGIGYFEQFMFRYNQAPGDVFGLRYSDLDGYGGMLPSYLIYKFYWSLAGILLLGGALLLWKRGLPYSFKERLSLGRKRFTGKIAMGFLGILIVFLSLGAGLFYEANVTHEYFTRDQKNKLLAAAEKRYHRYEHYVQPKIVSVKINMDIFPEKRTFQSSGEYWIVNKSDELIDTLVINYLPGLNTTYEFDRPIKEISKEKIATFLHFEILALDEALQPGDSLHMTFKNHNDPTSLLRTNDFVKSHGTFIEDDVFPRFGNWLAFARHESGLGGSSKAPKPGDEHAHVHSVMGKDADHIDFEAIVSTSSDQTAIAPGALKKKWSENNRNYYHYKMNEKITMSYLFMSGDYAVARDEWNGVDLEVYYDKGHAFNIDRIMAGMKAGLEYCSTNFSPYQFKQLRIVEFAQVNGSTAHGFPSVIPFGEGAGFIADVDDSTKGGTDYAYGTAVHEVAHMWWGHQVAPSDTRGAKLVVEAMAEYVNVKVKEHEKGKEKARHYLKSVMEQYLMMRTRQRRQESPLIYVYPDENYISYPKGAVVLNAMSDYIGETKFNKAIKDYVAKVAYQEDVYTTSVELLDYIRAATPDSLQYLIKDMFQTVTLYDNKMQGWNSTALPNGKFKVDLKFQVSKFRSGKNGKAYYSDSQVDSLTYKMEEAEVQVHSLPLADYIEIGAFNKDGNELFLQKVKITEISNSMSIILDEKPAKVGVDPHFKLIDRSLSDNLK